MIYERRYVQFNDLVIDGFDMIDETESDVSFKYVSHERTYGHGNYSPFKRNYVFANERSVSLTLHLFMKKLPCEKRPFYRQMAISELSKPGKLWAVVNGELTWAYAVMTNFGEQNSYRKDVLTINVDFTLPEGIWYKADLQKTFLQDYDVCTFMDCYDFKEIDPCKNMKKLAEENCCEICHGGTDEVTDYGCDCCVCDTLCAEMALCYNKERIQGVFGLCNDVDFHIVYDCLKGQEFFGDDYLGQKFCTEASNCDGVIAGQVYANTDIPTSSFDIIIQGQTIDPTIDINGNTNIIRGDFSENEGIMTIKPNGEVWYRESDCCEDTLVAANAWVIPEGNEYGWELKPGNNRLVIRTNACCGTVCAYVQVNGITI